MFRKILVFGLPFLLLSAPIFAGAAAETLMNPLGEGTTLATFMSRLLQLVVQIGFPVIVLYIIFIGFKFVQASGKPEELAKVRDMFFWALVGSLIVLGAQALVIAINATVEALKA